MELRKESVQMLQIKSRAASQVTFDTDYNVPDAKPDVGRLIQNKGDVSMDEVRLSEGKAFISGNLNVDILYVGEENQKVSSLGAKLPFDETLNLEGIEGVYPEFDVETYLQGECAPVFFGSALNNFGVQELLNCFVEIAPAPRPVHAEEREVIFILIYF